MGMKKLRCENAVEWGFDVPPEEVDLEEIYCQLGQIPHVFGVMYMGDFEKLAPKTHALFLLKYPSCGKKPYPFWSDK